MVWGTDTLMDVAGFSFFLSSLLSLGSFDLDPEALASLAPPFLGPIVKKLEGVW